MGQSVIRNSRKIHSQSGGDPSLPTRVTNLENNEYKITYYEVISGTSGSITIPTGATINAGEFGLSGNAILSKIDGSNKPTFESPKTAGGVVVTASLNETTGAWVASAVYTDVSVALIYSIKIKAINYSNLTYANIIETVDVGLAHLDSPTFTGTVTTPAINVSGLTPSQIVETDASKNLVSAAKGTAYNKNFGTGTTDIPEIGSTLGNSKPIITSSSGKLQTSDWTDITSSCTINGWISFSVNKIKSIDMGNYYIVNGQVVGTSNSSTTQVVLPFTNNGVQLDDCRFAINNGTNIFARCFMSAGSNTVDFRSTAAGALFSSLGTKAIYFTVVVEK